MLPCFFADLSSGLALTIWSINSYDNYYNNLPHLRKTYPRVNFSIWKVLVMLGNIEGPGYAHAILKINNISIITDFLQHLVRTILLHLLVAIGAY